MIKANTPLTKVLTLVHDCKCEKCEHGCKFGSGFMTEEDIKKMAAFLKITEEELKEKYLDEFEKFHTKRHKPKIKKKDMPYGQCIFFGEEGCKVHPAKPLECKIAMGCKEYGEDLITWFNLNYFVDPDDPQSVREWAIYLESGGNKIPGSELNDLIKDKKELKKILDYIKLGYEKDWEEELGIKDLMEEERNENSKKSKGSPKKKSK